MLHFFVLYVAFFYFIFISKIKKAKSNCNNNKIYKIYIKLSSLYIYILENEMWIKKEKEKPPTYIIHKYLSDSMEIFQIGLYLSHYNITVCVCVCWFLCVYVCLSVLYSYNICEWNESLFVFLSFGIRLMCDLLNFSVEYNKIHIKMLGI